MRTFVVIVLVALGALLSVAASIAVWAERAVFDEDEFVSTVDQVFEKEAVQTAIATQLANEVAEQVQIEQRIGDALADIEGREGGRAPEGLTLLAGPLSAAAEEVIFQAALRLIEAQPLRDVRNEALRGAHQVFIAIVEDDKEVLTTAGDEVVLDLGPLAEELVKEIGGEEGGDLLASIDLPEDTGQIVLGESSDLPPVRTMAGWLRDFSTWLPIAAVVAFALAVAISAHRRRTVLGIGVTLAAVAAIVVLLVALPLKEAITDALATTSTGRAAAEATYDILVQNFQRQQLFVILIGVGMAVGASLAGDPHLAAAIRSRLRRPEPAAAAAGRVSLSDWIRERSLALRIAGLGAAALFLIVWPDPSTRLVVTVVVLAAIYVAALTVVVSDADWAVTVRSRAGQLWERYLHVSEAPSAEPRTPAQSALRWVAARAPWFRAIGITVGVLLLVAWPSLTFGAIVVVIALELLYLAGIDMVANSVAD